MRARRRPSPLLAAALALALGCAEEERVRPTAVVQPDTGFYQELSWAPDGSRLLISILDWSGDGYTYHVATIAVDGSGFRSVTDGPLEYWTSWAPDGSRVAFAARREENTDIYAMGPDGSGRTRLTDDPASDTQPAWSPDGSRIAFVSDRDGTTRLWLMDADGSSPRPLGEAHGEAQNPAWSPDGDWIAYFESEVPGEDWIAVVRPDGSGWRRLARGVWPSWSPDGARVLYGGAEGIELVALEGGDPISVVDAAMSFARFSPDGSRLAYIAREGGEVAVRLADPDGSDPVELLRRPAPAW